MERFREGKRSNRKKEYREYRITGIIGQGKEMFVRSVFEGIRSGVCECVYRKECLTPLIYLWAVSGMICLSFRDRFDILLEKRPSGVAELRHTMLYGKSQIN